MLRRAPTHRNVVDACGGVAHVLLATAARLRTSDPAKADAYVERASTLAAGVLSDVREMVSILHDETRVEHAPILPLLERIRLDFETASTIDLTWNVHFDREPSGRSAIVLYRVLQEAFTNVARHAHAPRARVDIQGNEHEIVLHIEDDGRGFVAGATGGYGMISMRTRVEDANGTFELSSQPGKGTSLSARIPLEAAP